MHQKFLVQLPAALVALVEQIEAYAGKEIEVIEWPGRPTNFVDHTRAVVGTPNPDAIDVDGMRHELLHIKRNWNDQVPQIYAVSTNPDNVQAIAELDNIAEHLAIVPLETQYGAACPFAIWNHRSLAWWSAMRWQNIIDPVLRRYNMLKFWLTVDFLTDDQAVRVLAEDALRAQGFLHAGQAMSAALKRELNSKPNVAAILAHFLQMNRADLTLRTFDVRQNAASNQTIAGWNP